MTNRYSVLKPPFVTPLFLTPLSLTPSLAKPVLTGLCAAIALANAVAVNAKQSQLQEIEIHAHPLSAEGLSQPAAVLQGDALSQALQMSIGATVAVEPGVHLQSFGEASGRPVMSRSMLTL